MNYIERAVKALEQAHEAALHGNPLTAQQAIEKAREREAQRVAGDGLEVSHTDPAQRREPVEGPATGKPANMRPAVTRPASTKPATSRAATTRPATTRAMPATGALPAASVPTASPSASSASSIAPPATPSVTPATTPAADDRTAGDRTAGGRTAATVPGTDDAGRDSPVDGASDPTLDPSNVDTYTGAVFRNHAERVRAAHVRALRAKIDQVEASVDEAPVSLPSGPVRAATAAQADLTGSTVPLAGNDKPRVDDSVPLLSRPLPDSPRPVAAADEAEAPSKIDDKHQTLSDVPHVSNSDNVTKDDGASTLNLDPMSMLSAVGGRLKLKAIRAEAYLDPNGHEDPLREAFEPMADDLLGQVASMGRTNSMARRIMLTSVEPGAGRSLCALHLALSMAVDHNQSVIYVDTDFDGHPLLPTIGVKPGPGVADWLDHQVTEIDALVVPTQLIGLKLIGTGSASALTRRSENLNRQSLNAFLLALSARYPEDLVIIDGEPLTDDSSATMLAGLAGQVVIVVEADRTPRRRLEQALGVLQRHARVSVMLNKVH